MKTEQCRILLKFCYNQIDYAIFKNLFLDAYTVPSDNGYLMEKWKNFTHSTVSFLIQHPEFMERTQKEIEKINYEG